MIGLNYHPKARLELLEATDYYEQHRAGLGKEFRAAVEELAADIARQPELGPLLHDVDCRKRLMHRFPYTLFYRLTHRDVLVVAIAHQKRKPDYWNDRLGNE